MTRPLRLGIFVSHPVQYHVPIWRQLAQMEELEVKVHYFSDHSVRGGVDPGFGLKVSWDTPLLEGYDFEFVTDKADITKPRTFVLPTLRRWLGGDRFDWVLIAGYTYPFEYQLLQAATRYNYRVLMRGEFTDLKRQPETLTGRLKARAKQAIRHQILRQLYKRVDAFACVGEQAKRHLLKRGVPENAIFFSPYSVNSAEFARQKEGLEREVCRAQLGVDDDTFVFLYSGKLIPRKEVVRLVEAFGLLKDRDHVALLILGDGEQREEVCEKGRKHLGERFLFQGFVNQSKLGQYFMAADAFVLPSNYEAWGLVVNEAMQFGLPVLLSHMIGSHLDLLQPGETGYLFQAEDTADLARALERMASDPAHARQMGKNAEALIQQYSTDVSAQGIRDAILSLPPK